MSAIVGISIITLIVSWCIESFSKKPAKMGKNGPETGFAGYIFMLSVLVLIICFLIAIFRSKVTGDSGGYLHSD